MDISVIIPVYNKQNNSLKRCFDSVIGQIDIEFEIILIDDGSKSSCAEFLDVYAQSNNQVRVYHIDNAGAANARNIGIGYATGKYIMFIDADDYLPDKYVFSQMYSAAEQGEKDIVFGCYNKVTNHPFPILTSEEIQIKIIEQTDICEVIPLGSPWSKLFLREYIIKNSIQFNKDLRRSHDRMFMLNAMEHHPNYLFLNYCCYHFCIDEGDSLSRSFNPKTKNFLCNYLDECEKFVKRYHGSNTAFERAVDSLRVVLFRQYAQQGPFHPGNNNKLYERIKDLKQAKKEIIKNNPCVIIRNKGKAMEVFSLLLRMRWYLALALCLEINKKRYK